ncbi:hypothetical protein [Archangium violaceum]|uniref:Uncharacterized protein n=1 Tax=Archangium violaceum Cb vi76 TaxID=1406225 RepID=A0A084SF81_9BACT|nr:hypothetical protein [Archangium violaceum]KFA87116.1 hypothetical protein Q664_50035 [Archangium violaceum Cb vi76]
MLQASPNVVAHSDTGTPFEDGAGSGVREAAEVVAQGDACYTGLLRVMRSPRWKRLMRAQPDWLRGALRLETPVRELLARDGGGCPRLLRQRERLEVLARKRLSHFTRRGGASLGEVLGRLETLLSEPRPQPPGGDEPVLLEGRQGLRNLLSWPGTWVFALLAITNRYGLERFGRPAPMLFAGGALVLYYYLRCTGHFWLTAKRLMWQPRFGEPVQVSLASIGSKGISALPAWGQVRVEGDRAFTVRHAGQASLLASLLDLHRQSPFAGEVDGTPRVHEVSVLPAWRAPERARAGEKSEPGVAVLRPGYAAFLPAERYADVFRVLTGPGTRKPEADVTVELLVEHMRLLSEPEFDVRMRQVVLASGGELWHADEVRSGPAVDNGRVRLGARGMGMELLADAAQAEATDRIVRRWAA